MTTKILAVLLLSLAVTACESNSSETPGANAGAKPSPSTTASATPAPVATSEANSSATAPISVGDKVKLTISGSITEATVISIDQKAGKATVRVRGQKEDKTVALTEIVKQ